MPAATRNAIARATIPTPEAIVGQRRTSTPVVLPIAATMMNATRLIAAPVAA
jgi:hypothetical protein